MLPGVFQCMLALNLLCRKLDVPLAHRDGERAGAGSQAPQPGDIPRHVGLLVAAEILWSAAQSWCTDLKGGFSHASFSRKHK